MIKYKYNGEVSTRLIVALAVVGIFIVAAVPLGFYIWPVIKKAFEEPVPPSPVGVVRTSGQMKALKPFKLPGGGEVRIGISSETSYVGGAIMVYCLAENSSEIDYIGVSDLPASRKLLGPIHYRVRFLGDKRKGKLLEDLKKRSLPRPEGDFFFNMIVTPEKGEYIIEFYDSSEKPVTTRNITASRETPHPWQRIDFTRNGPGKHVISNSARDFIAMPVSGCPSGGMPLPQKLPRIPFDTQEHATGDFNLTVSGNAFILKSEERFSWYPNRHILVRFKVNGKPFIPQTEKDDLPRVFKKYTGKLGSINEMTIIPRLDYGLLGVKTGDEISIQMIYAGDWDIVYKKWTHVSQRSGGYGRGGSPRVSNIVKIKCK